MRSREYYVEDIATMLGGFAAEQIFYGETSPGPSNDMKEITKLARKMVTQWGMSDTLGPRTYGEQEDMIFLGREIHENRNYSEKVAERIDAEVDRIINEGLEKAKRLITAHRDVVERVTDKLLEKETLEREEFYAVVGLPPANPMNDIKEEDIRREKRRVERDQEDVAAAAQEAETPEKPERKNGKKKAQEPPTDIT
jgi:cell division protease FtsH